MRVYLKALFKCKYPVKLNEKWLTPAIKLPTNLLRCWYVNWLMGAHKFHSDSDKELKSQARLFMAYDGALDCPGRDTDEFVNLCVDRLGETITYWEGRTPPRVEMILAFDDPEKYPYQYVKWKTRLVKYNVVKYVRKHYTWISLSVLLALLNVLSLLLINYIYGEI